jgi:hypothetical protein
MSHAGKPKQDTPDSPGHFLERWSRRKVEARAGDASADDSDAVSTSPVETGADAPQVHQQEPVLTDADMPPVETLNAESDFSPFMSPGVSDGLRQKALRILFRNPACNMVDGLNDYDEDYTQFAGLGDVVTQEMKRMLKRELAAEADSEADAAGRQADVQPAGVEEPATEPADQAPDPSRAAAGVALDRDVDDEADKG